MHYGNSCSAYYNVTLPNKRNILNHFFPFKLLPLFFRNKHTHTHHVVTHIGVTPSGMEADMNRRVYQ